MINKEFIWVGIAIILFLLIIPVFWTLEGHKSAIQGYFYCHSPFTLFGIKISMVDPNCKIIDWAVYGGIGLAIITFIIGLRGY